MLCNTGGLTKIPLEELPASVKQLTLHRNSFGVIKTEAFAGLRLLSNLFGHRPTYNPAHHLDF